MLSTLASVRSVLLLLPLRVGPRHEHEGLQVVLILCYENEVLCPEKVSEITRCLCNNVNSIVLR